MRKNFLPLLFACSTAAAALFPALKAGSKNANNNAVVASVAVAETGTATEKSVVKAAATALYDSLQLNDLGLSYEALEYALTGYQQLKERGVLKNEGVITVCDFSQSSFKKRMYILDVKNFKVLKNTYVAHGKNSGLQMAEKFSNTPESLQSSLGFFVTKATYSGKHGLSLKLDGQERGWNDKAEERAVVVHGADYIGAHRAGSAYMGRSFGCPAVPQAQAAEVINLIKNGTCFFIYHPSQSYLHGSKLLNV